MCYHSSAGSIKTFKERIIESSTRATVNLCWFDSNIICFLQFYQWTTYQLAETLFQEMKNGSMQMLNVTKTMQNLTQVFRPIIINFSIAFYYALILTLFLSYSQNFSISHRSKYTLLLKLYYLLLTIDSSFKSIGKWVFWNPCFTIDCRDMYIWQSVYP